MRHIGRSMPGLSPLQPLEHSTGCGDSRHPGKINFAHVPGVSRTCHDRLMPPEEQHGLWGWIVGNGSGISASVATITAIVATVTLIRAGRDSRARSRPSVVAEFQIEPDSDSAYSLVIRNVGPSLARDLRVTSDPPLAADPVPKSADDRLVRRFGRVIPTLAPGQALRSLWALHAIKEGGKGNIMATPEDVTVTVTYRGTGRKVFTDQFDLIGESITLGTAVTSSTSIKGRLKTLAEEATKQRRALERLASRGEQ